MKPHLEETGVKFSGMQLPKMHTNALGKDECPTIANLSEYIRLLWYIKEEQVE